MIASHTQGRFLLTVRPLPRARMQPFLALGLATLALGVSTGAPAALNAQRSSVRSLRIINVTAPEVPSRQVRTEGAIPQVVGPRWAVVNRAIRNVVVLDQRHFAASVASRNIDSRTAPGAYETKPNRRLISASTVVLSALIPTIRRLPGLNGGAGWLSITLDTASGKQIHWADLFTHPTVGLSLVASSARHLLVANNRCVRNSLNDPTIGHSFASGFRPTKRNYRYFALLNRGIAVGFPLGQVGGIVCGRVTVVIGYARFERLLSRQGTRLVSNVRPPR
jgi:hypothetical protein